MKILLDARIDMIFHDGHHISEFGLRQLRLFSLTNPEMVPLVLQSLEDLSCMRWSIERIVMQIGVLHFLRLAT